MAGQILRFAARSPSGKVDILIGDLRLPDEDAPEEAWEDVTHLSFDPGKSDAGGVWEVLVYKMEGRRPTLLTTFPMEGDSLRLCISP